MQMAQVVTGISHHFLTYGETPSFQTRDGVRYSSIVGRADPRLHTLQYTRFIIFAWTEVVYMHGVAEVCSWLCAVLHVISHYNSG